MPEIQTGDGARLWCERAGSPYDPPLLLVMGMGASMLWWDEPLWRALAAGGRHVIRYDHRDTGRSSADAPGEPRYDARALSDDVLAVLDGCGLESAHLVGLSMGGGLIQRVALEAPARVRSLTLISSSPLLAVDRELPGMTDEYRRFLADSAAGGEPVAVTARAERLVAEWRVLSGSARPFEADRVRTLALADVRRARNPASAANHALAESRPQRPDASMRDIAAPTLVVHGTADPLFPLAHGEALADAIPGAALLTLPGAGHGLASPDWEVVAAAILAHTAPGGYEPQRATGRGSCGLAPPDSPAPSVGSGSIRRP